jgi:hypothetical protein
LPAPAAPTWPGLRLQANQQDRGIRRAILSIPILKISTYHRAGMAQALGRDDFTIFEKSGLLALVEIHSCWI